MSASVVALCLFEAKVRVEVIQGQIRNRLICQNPVAKVRFCT